MGKTYHPGSSQKKRNRHWLLQLYNAQEGLCCHCHLPMIYMGATNEDSPHRASIEHVISARQDSSLMNSFSNYLAAHKRCNNDRKHNPPTQELLDYQKEIHEKIMMSGCPHVLSQPISDFILTRKKTLEHAILRFNNYVPHGYTLQDLLRALNISLPHQGVQTSS